MRFIKLIFLFTLTSCLLIGCGGSGGSAGVASDNNDTLSTGDLAAIAQDAPMMPALYALEILRDSSGDLSFGDVEYFSSVSGVYRPLERMTGDYVAIAYANDVIVDAVPVSFAVQNPRELIREGAPEEFFTDRVQIQIDASVAVDRIDLVDSAMTVHARVSEFPAAPSGLRLQVGQRAFARYPWIDLMSTGDSFPALDAGAPNGVITLDTDEIGAIEAMLDSMPPRLVSAVDTLAFSDIDAPGLAFAGHVIIDTDMLYNPDVGRLYWTLVHEAGHAYHNLSGAAAGRDFGSWGSEWPAGVLAEVRLTHKQFGFDRDVLTFWRELQQAAVDENIALNYQGEGNQLGGEPYRNGFVTGYAATHIAEDFADTVAMANFKGVQDRSPQLNSGVCQFYQLNGTANIPLTKFTALAYTKIRLVQAMELADDDSVEWCLQNVAPTYEDGIFLGDALHFDRELTAGYTSTTREQFNIVGQDPERRGMAIELSTEGGHPVGVYPLDLTWWGAWDGSNTLVIASPSAIEARTARSGVVVVTNARSSDRVEGFVFDLRLNSAFGPASQFTFVPFKIPL